MDIKDFEGPADPQGGFRKLTLLLMAELSGWQETTLKDLMEIFRRAREQERINSPRKGPRSAQRGSLRAYLEAHVRGWEAKDHRALARRLHHDPGYWEWVGQQAKSRTACEGPEKRDMRNREVERIRQAIVKMVDRLQKKVGR